MTATFSPSGMVSDSAEGPTPSEPREDLDPSELEGGGRVGAVRALFAAVQTVCAGSWAILTGAGSTEGSRFMPTE